jgi:hypothetical protein
MQDFFGWNGGMIFWIVIGVISVAAIFFRYRESVSRDETIRMLAEKGQPIPPELIGGESQGSWTRDGNTHYHFHYRRRHPFRAGVILVCVGIALYVSSFGWHHGADEWGNWHISGAIFPLMIGIALLIIGVFERRPPPPPAR